MSDPNALRSLLPVVYSILIFVLPWLAAFLLDRELAGQRKAQGEPPPKFGFVKGLTLLYALGFAAGIIFVIVPDIYKWKVRDNVYTANNYAKNVSFDAAEAWSEADCKGEILTDEYIIGRYADTGTVFQNKMHELALEHGGQTLNGWYAVQIDPNGGVIEIKRAWFSGNELTLSDLHEWDFETQYAQAKRFGTDTLDLVGYYTPKPKETSPTT